MTKVASHYDQVADIYDSRYDESGGNTYYSHICSGVMRNLPKDAKLLDLGCGTGLFMERYLRFGGEVIGLDISRNMIVRAKERTNSDVTLGTAEQLPFKDDTFDCVSSVLAFSYLQNPQGTVEDIYRVLKPGGSVSICTLGKNVFTSAVPTAHKIGEKLHVKSVGMVNITERYYKQDELSDLLKSAGFTDVSVKRRSFAHVSLSPSLYSIAKKFEPIIESKIPYLAFNMCASGIKPKN